MQENPSAVTAEVREALYELQQYLSDAVAPLMVADSIEILLRAPVALTAAQINAWAGAQYRGPNAALPVSDYLFHAIKKIHLIGEYDLVSRENLGQFVQELARQVLSFCPPEDRDLLRVSLSRLGEAPTVLASSVEYVHRQAGPAGRPLTTREAAAPLSADGIATPNHSGSIPVSVTPELARGLRSFALLMQRMERNYLARPADNVRLPEGERAAFSELLTMAAVNSHSESELSEHLARLREIGFEGRPRDLFRDLGRTLPDWSPPSGYDMFAPLAPAEAMQKIITLAEDPSQGAQRFREMVEAAIEQFNEGSLGRAATMFDLAERIILEKKVDFPLVQSVRTKFADTLDPEVLRRFSESPEKHPMLRKVLNFFTALTPQGLLQEVQVEERREKRRLALALLEVHAGAAREVASERLLLLVEDPGTDPQRYLARNLLYLLRRIPAGEADLTLEVDAAALMLRPDTPAYLLKEAVAYLGQVKHERGERALISFLANLEQMLFRRTAEIDAQETRQVIDRTVAALGRLGTPSAARAIINHALKRNPVLGDTMARLAELGSQDLSYDPGMVELLLKTLKSELPLRILGFVVQRSSAGALHVIGALAGTPAATVRSALEEIAQRFPGEEFGRAAAQTLAGFGALPRVGDTQPSIGLSGDLELFGLPSLLQTLAESNVSGVLSLREGEAEAYGVVAFEEGKIVEAQTGGLRGAEAVYQLFERPLPGTFQFSTRREGAAERERSAVPLEVIPTLFEAMRRYDEYRQARILVPDHATFQISGIRPSAHPDERDPNVARQVWNKIQTGANALECETDVPADVYRIRRLLVHWVDQGALQQI